MGKRTDIHSPSNIILEDYEFFGCGNFPTSEIDSVSPLMSPEGRRLLDEGWRFANVETGGCQHCGAHLIYYAVLLHEKTKSFVRVGETCLDNRFSLATSEFQKLRKAAALNRDRKRLSDKREEWLSASPDNQAAYDYAKSVEGCDDLRCATHKRPLYKCYNDYFESWDCDSFENIFIRSVDRKGEASEGFVASMIRSKGWRAEREAKKAAERAELEANGQPVVEGKQEITGEIVKLDIQVNDFGSREVMIVKDDKGFKVWGTQPSSLYEAEVGDRVTFTATVTKSDKDEYFGFFKRPSKAEVL